MSAPKEGDVRVWWMPQIPCKAFFVDVPNAAAGKLMVEALANYDLFQFENNIKPDYANAGGVERFESGEWCSLDDEDLEEAIAREEAGAAVSR